MQVKRELRFLDSFRFMATSLEALSTNLSNEQCKNVKSRYTGEQLDPVLRKGVYPYDYMDSLERLDETQLPWKLHSTQSLTTQILAMKTMSVPRWFRKNLDVKRLETTTTYTMFLMYYY